ncbi:hypothetical protein M0813_25639 [Anaeramoeba flamelloides]|uniref:BTB domain-containing protein n=1 Tax=Anaeramoeba flamelloides TaxID=1746091 RepID=A0ABQ8Y2R2_9EUKA|nr:hypothetical protein M0813_25639 [Anaeramoeba flamelloides]
MDSKNLKNQLKIAQAKISLLQEKLKEKEEQLQKHLGWINKVNNMINSKYDAEEGAQWIANHFSGVYLSNQYLEEEEIKQGKNYPEIYHSKKLYFPDLYDKDEITAEILLPEFEKWRDTQIKKKKLNKKKNRFVIPFQVNETGFDGCTLDYSFSTKNGNEVHQIVEKRYLQILPQRQLSRDLLSYFSTQEFGTDEIKGFKYDPAFLKIRLRLKGKKSFKRFARVMKKQKKDQIQAFFEWAYGGSTEIISNPFIKSHYVYKSAKQTKLKEESLNKCKNAIQDKLKTSFATWEDSLLELFNDDDSKDFEIIIPGETKVSIKAHKFILISRCGMFKAFFQSMKEDQQSSTDFSKRSLKFWKIFIRYLYTSKIVLDEELDKNTLNEFKDAAEYFQLNDHQSVLYNLLKEKL